MPKRRRPIAPARAARASHACALRGVITAHEALAESDRALRSDLRSMLQLVIHFVMAGGVRSEVRPAAAPPPFRKQLLRQLPEMVRSAPVAIHRPAAPAGVTIRIRNKGLSQTGGIAPDPMSPEKWASPCAPRGTSGVSRTAWGASPTLQTRVPVTPVIGPGVPLNPAPLIDSPCTSNEANPVV